jgi:hypothetical protein
VSALVAGLLGCILPRGRVCALSQFDGLTWASGLESLILEDNISV